MTSDAIYRALEQVAKLAPVRTMEHAEEVAVATVSAALDVEEMSKVLDLHGGEAFLVTGGGQITECPTCGQVPTDLASHLAATLRTEILEDAS